MQLTDHRMTALMEVNRERTVLNILAKVKLRKVNEFSSFKDRHGLGGFGHATTTASVQPPSSSSSAAAASSVSRATPSSVAAAAVAASAEFQPPAVPPPPPPPSHAAHPAYFGHSPFGTHHPQVLIVPNKQYVLHFKIRICIRLSLTKCTVFTTQPFWQRYFDLKIPDTLMETSTLYPT